MKNTKTLFAIASAAILAVGTQFAGAVPTLRISDGTLTLDVVDNSGQDDTGLAGKVRYNGQFGQWWIDVSTTGTTMPFQGSNVSPYMDLNFVVSSQTATVAPPSLTIQFSEIGFGPMNSFANFADSIGGTIGGTAASSVSCSTSLDVANALFGGSVITGKTFNGNGAFSCEASAAGQTTAPFSLTKTIVVTHPAGTWTTSGDTEITVPDGGTTLALLGGSLLGLGAIRRKLVKA